MMREAGTIGTVLRMQSIQTDGAGRCLWFANEDQAQRIRSVDAVRLFARPALSALGRCESMREASFQFFLLRSGRFYQFFQPFRRQRRIRCLRPRVCLSL